MAGDHKCPVCQSTFTRPQHVARHMRSHTGDRPYKCQHCGDQFARSDLLSRHVNKCHASEKPPTTTAPNRRKGAVAASRATTSKQACDQCVQSSLPCDGANPCAKCLQRKCRCTYVKFHRQTAPQGPGHPLPNQAPQPGRQILPGASQEFILPPQNAFSFPSVYSSNPNDQYNIPSTSASLYAQGYPNASDPRDPSAPVLGLSASARDALSNSPDIMARYRAQAELLSRAGVLPNGNLAVGTAPGTDGVIPPHALYSDAQAQAHFNRYSVPMPANPWAQPHDVHPQQSFQGIDRKDFDEHYRQSFPAREGSITTDPGDSSLQAHPSTHGSTFPSISSNAGAPGGYPHTNIAFHHHPEDLNDDFGSDGGSHSIPNSANSSNAHLPLPDVHHQHHRQQNYSLPGFPHLDTLQNADSSVNNGQNGHKQQYTSSAFGHDGQGEGGFSSAFGLMSLDDPNVLAGLSADSAPFFSNLGGSGSHANGSGTNLSLQTPTQDLIAALKTGKSDMDTKEMRDFWKMYVRTPLSGPGGNGFALATPTNSGQMLGAGRPSPTRRHSRVASLPSMKTPPLHAEAAANGFAPLGRSSMNDPRQQAHPDHDKERGEDGQVNPNAFSSMRTTFHGAEDLKSYEQAVLARKAPMTLNLAPRRRGTIHNGVVGDLLQAQAQPQLQREQAHHNAHTSKSASPLTSHLPPPPASNKITDLLNRPSSTSSNNSSLAHAFGHTESRLQGHDSRPSSQSGCQGMRPPSVASSTAVGSDTGAESDSSYRPSFKRLASQTLGPENTKRALLGPAGWDDDVVDDDDDDDGDYAQRRSISSGLEVDQAYAGATAGRPTVGMSDRLRRASAPTTAIPQSVLAMPVSAFAQPADQAAASGS
ncbi:hypothetical protein POSPLADRAFT_1071323 [Postia placenta MAD-698-R-SB12]|uniref:Zn(2)-C6 fungal-type domain-containing protein n=1 Tax=Postia placenta MAD-698-R-SB12 TaxID=670580 RepID=A0A1X6MSJ4_9APHY|nr:hypothetical protein POSPLADRAFT_1071323 [Postia placenta MAD-698-R-SB12]OSX59143.1 hypothetical protein POSPLADRAFT_1071323 [Postia placenta MAD-698-R-SB12]